MDLSKSRCLRALILSVGAVCIILCGCSPSGSSGTTTATLSSITSETASTTPGENAITTAARQDGATPQETSTTMQASTTTTAPALMSDVDKDLGRTSTLQHAYAVYLSNSGAADNDPRLAIFYGLRARTQALSCLSALEKNQTDIADLAMREVYRAMNEAQALATAKVAQVLADARAIIATLGSPSQAPDQAVELLKRFVAALTPLVDEAALVLSSTTTTLGR